MISVIIFVYSLSAICAFMVMFAPLNVAILALLTSTHLNLTWGATETGTISWLNALRIIILPTVLYVRFIIKGKTRRIKYGKGYVVWLVFCIYSILSCFWLMEFNYIQYIKQVGYLYTYTITFMLLCRSYITKYLNEKVIIYSAICATIIAIIQTYYFGNIFGQTLNWDRFVSFSAKQQFAEFLLSIFVLLIASKKLNYKSKIIIVLILFLQLLLNGSRTGIMGMVAALVIIIIFEIINKRIEAIKFMMVLFSFVVISILIGGSFYKNEVKVSIDKIRISELFDYAKDNKLNKIGSMNDRVNIWKRVTNEIEDFDVVEHVSGRGLTSGSKFVSKMGLHDASVSANRIFHNDYLRIYYELGLIGELIFITFIGFVVLLAFKLMVINHDCTLLAFIPGFIAFLGVENILAASGNAGGMGIMLVLSYSVVANSKTISENEKNSNSASRI